MAIKATDGRVVVKAALRILAVDDIQVDRSYQRGLVPKHRKIAAEFNPEAFGVPVVGERADGSMWVVDGQQRLAALKIRGTKKVRAEVFASTGPEYEAEVFRLINLNRTRLRPFEEYTALLTAHDKLAWLVKDAVESQGFVISGGGKPTNGSTHDARLKTITGVATVMSIGKRGGADGIAFVLSTVKAAWPVDPARNHNDILEGLFLFWNGMERTVDADRLIPRLASTTPAKILFTAALGVGGRYSQVADAIGRLYQKRSARKPKE